MDEKQSEKKFKEPLLCFSSIEVFVF